MIPVHKGKNLAGISSEFISDPFGFTCVATSTMSHFYKVTIPGYRIFVISKADLVKHVLITKSNKYGKGRIYWKSLSRITGTGLATSEGPHWLQRRRLMQPFFSKNVICKYITDIGRIAARYYSLKLGTNKEGVVSDMFQIGNETTSEITLYNLLGLGPQEYSSEFYEKVKRSQEYILYCAKYPWNEFLSAFNGKKKLFKQDVRYFDNIIYKHIHDRKNDTGASNNILTELVQCKDEKGIPAYSNKQIRDDYITLLGGGSENSSACFAWTMYLLWKHPEKLNRLRTEVDSLLGLDQTVNENIINHLNYTEMVLKE